MGEPVPKRYHSLVRQLTVEQFLEREAEEVEHLREAIAITTVGGLEHGEQADEYAERALGLFARLGDQPADVKLKLLVTVGRYARRSAAHAVAAGNAPLNSILGGAR
jgi:hypothetical protein